MNDPAVLPALFDVLAVVRAGSVGAAAGRLHKTASAVSQQIRRAEDFFGLKFFERQGRGLRLTAAGEAALVPLSRLFDETEAVYRTLGELAGAPPATLRIAASDYLGKGLLVPVLREFSGRGVPLRFEITTAHSADSLVLLERGDVEMAIVTDPRPGFRERFLFGQTFCWVGAPSRGRKSSIDERLSREPVLRLSPGSVGRTLLDGYLQARAIRPLSTIDVPSVSLLLAYAAGGAGVGLAPVLPVEEPALEPVRLGPAAVAARPVKLVVRPHHRPTAVVEQFIEKLVETAGRRPGPQRPGRR